MVENILFLFIKAKTESFRFVAFFHYVERYLLKKTSTYLFQLVCHHNEVNKNLNFVLLKLQKIIMYSHYVENEV